MRKKLSSSEDPSFANPPSHKAMEDTGCGGHPLLISGGLPPVALAKKCRLMSQPHVAPSEL